MELSPYVFDGDYVISGGQSNVWDNFSPYVPAIPKEHQPSNPAASISPNPKLDEEAAKAVVENVRGPEHEAAVAQAEALRVRAKAEAARAAAEKAAKRKPGFLFSRLYVPPTTFSDGYTGDITRGQPKAQNRADFSKWRREGQLKGQHPQPPPAAPPVKRIKWRDALLKLRTRKSFPFASFKHLPSVKRLASFSMRKQWET
jgi:hypothetical protein